MGVLGIGFYFARIIRFIWSLGSLSGKNPRLIWTLLKHCCLNFPGSKLSIRKSDFDVQPVYELVSTRPTKWYHSQPKIIHP